MASQLYTLAQGLLLAAEQRRLTEFETWLSDINEPHLDSARLLANVRDECHLVGARQFGDPNELAAFLGACGQAHSKATSEFQRRAGYSSACSAFELKGLGVEQTSLPAGFLKYSTSKTLAATLVERMLGKIARRDFDSGLMSVEDAFNRMALYWSTARLTDDEMLARSKAVFATFEHEGTAPRDDARALADALALPVLVRVGAGEEILFEFSYQRDSVQGHRFPTVADVGWFHLFQPAPEVAPDPAERHTFWGWTRPLGGQQSQPEIVHENARLRVIDSAPRLVGRMTI
jgi:hypothetical protein